MPIVRAKRLVTKPSIISKEKKHLSSGLVSGGYTSSFVQREIKTRTPTISTEPPAELRSTAVLPYVKGFSEKLCCCIKQGMHAVFKSNTTLPSHLVRPKDAVDPAKQDGVVYNIHCECGKVCIGETSRLMWERI